jgi:hypothetical protein
MMPDLLEAVRTFDLGGPFSDIVDAIFLETSVRYKWTAMARTVSVTGTLPDVGALGLGETIQSYAVKEDFYTYAILLRNGVAHITLKKAGEIWAVDIYVSAATLTEADAAANRIAKAFRLHTHVDDKTVELSFWCLAKHGPYYWKRRVAAPAWDMIALNYAARTRDGLATLMAMRPPAGGGQLVLLHGEPGTGKTYAIRSLVRQWRRWCWASYIVDPEKFFGEADYMMSVLTDPLPGKNAIDEEGDLEPHVTDAPADLPDDVIAELEDRPRKHGVPSHKWHLLIMEDADEFVSVDAKSKIGQSLVVSSTSWTAWSGRGFGSCSCCRLTRRSAGCTPR